LCGLPAANSVHLVFRAFDAMLAQFRAAGAEVKERIEECDYGRFGWAIDPEGNRIELWQPH
jgi:predicted enzyme related to lactoylglutathione lyase